MAKTLAPETLLLVDEAIERLAEEDPEAAQLVKLRFFIGLEMTEIAKTMEISERAAYRLWAFARAWLHKQLRPRPSASQGGGSPDGGDESSCQEEPFDIALGVGNR